jgi:hypothetical protein
MKPDPPVKERIMRIPKPSKNVQTAAIAGAAGTAGAIITLVAVSAAFRVPKELKKFLPNNKNRTDYTK